MLRSGELPGLGVSCGKTALLPGFGGLSAPGEPDDPEYLWMAYGFMYSLRGLRPEAICRITFILWRV